MSLRSPASTDRGDFALQISFPRGMRDPSCLFRTMADLITAVEDLDNALAESIDTRIRPAFVLEQIEVSSLRVWIRNLIESIEDDDLRDSNWKRIVGKFLVRAKRAILEYLRDRETVASRSELRPLEERLLQLARETDVLRIPSYASIRTSRLLYSCQRMITTVSLLPEDETVSYIAESEEIVMNRQFSISSVQIDDIVTSRTIQNTTDMILEVKKPDYLGLSMWDLRHDNHPIRAKIADQEWLRGFQARETEVRPGDALRARVQVTVHYDEQNRVVDEHHEILQVLEVLHPAQARQGDLT